jgi:hypothetical protein
MDPGPRAMLVLRDSSIHDREPWGVLQDPSPEAPSPGFSPGTAGRPSIANRADSSSRDRHGPLRGPRDDSRVARSLMSPDGGKYSDSRLRSLALARDDSVSWQDPQPGDTLQTSNFKLRPSHFTLPTSRLSSTGSRLSPLGVRKTTGVAHVPTRRRHPPSRCQPLLLPRRRAIRPRHQQRPDRGRHRQPLVPR